MEKFSEYLINLRFEQGLSQNKLAKALGVSASLISFLEHDKIKPTFKLAKKISVRFDIPMEELKKFMIGV